MVPEDEKTGPLCWEKEENIKMAPHPRSPRTVACGHKFALIVTNICSHCNECSVFMCVILILQHFLKEKSKRVPKY